MRTVEPSGLRTRGEEPFFQALKDGLSSHLKKSHAPPGLQLDILAAGLSQRVTTMLPGSDRQVGHTAYGPVSANQK